MINATPLDRAKFDLLNAYYAHDAFAFRAAMERVVQEAKAEALNPPKPPTEEGETS